MIKPTNKSSIMKKTKKLLLLLYLPLFFVTCEKTEDGSYVAPLTIYEKLAGTWNLNSVKVIDEIARASSIRPDEVKLIDKFGFADFTITFSVNADSLPTTFAVGGDAPELFLSGGYWDLDSPFIHTDGSPIKIYLYTDAAKSTPADSLSITLVPGTKAILGFKLTRSSEGTPYASYEYNLRIDE